MRPLLEVDGLTKQFGGLLAVSQLKFSVGEGEIVGLIGPNGAGKTTTFNLLTGFDTPTAGSIQFRGKQIVGLRPYQICRLGMARTFQIVKPLNRLAVLENVMVGAFCRHRDRRHARAIAEQEVAFVGLQEHAYQNSASLTLSNRKRLELARALATGPSFLLLDEVMAGLNPTETEAAVDLLRRIHARGISMILIEHVMRVVMALSQRVVVLVQGQCLVVGDPATVAADPRVATAYLGAPRA
ncbi:MAG: ABC transporter ATP-binding protein [Pseudolabrys sp.]|nr:ABC transporter ATP-binding protein [Pseudolabrys sp.]